MEFTIEKGIAISASRRRGRPMKYPWTGLCIGDSFLAPPGRSSYVSMAKRYGLKITSRKEENGIRIWRIA